MRRERAIEQVWIWVMAVGLSLPAGHSAAKVVEREYARIRPWEKEGRQKGRKGQIRRRKRNGEEKGKEEAGSATFCARSLFITPGNPLCFCRRPAGVGWRSHEKKMKPVKNRTVVLLFRAVTQTEKRVEASQERAQLHSLPLNTWIFKKHFWIFRHWLSNALKSNAPPTIGRALSFSAFYSGARDLIFRIFHPI